MKDILPVCIEAAEEAGVFLKEHFGRIESIEHKADHSIATNLDHEAEQLIIARIHQSFPHHGILAEESGFGGNLGEYVWVIDPLDGTHNFVRGIDLFGVSIGVSRNDEFIAGVIYLPFQQELYIGEKGNGAYKNGKRIHVSEHRQLSEATVSFDSNIRRDPQNKLKILGELSSKVFNLRMLGASVRVLSYIADGKVDATVEIGDRAWDFAAGSCIVREAGGKATDLRGEPLTYRSVGYIISNGWVHDAVQGIVGEA